MSDEPESTVDDGKQPPVPWWKRPDVTLGEYLVLLRERDELRADAERLAGCLRVHLLELPRDAYPVSRRALAAHDALEVK